MELEFRVLQVEEYGLAEQFKRATALDATGRDDLFDTWFPPEWSYAKFLARMQAFDPESCVLALVNGKPVGHLDLRIKEDGTGYLNNIYLKPEWRGQRLGDQMDAYAMRFFAKHGTVRAALRTMPSAHKVVAYYERLGWVQERMCDDGMVWMEKDVGAGA